MKPLSALCILCLCAVLGAGPALARTFGNGPNVAFELPPLRPVSPVAYVAPRPGERAGSSLDEPWQFVQYLYDADTTSQNYAAYLNAVPVQFAFCRNTNGFLATLHTVFETSDCGRTWHNLDLHPQPSTIPSDWGVLRSPMYISGLAARPITRPGINLDTVLVSAYSATADTSNVRVIYYQGGHRLYPFRQLDTPVWLSGVLVPDSTTGLVFGGMTGRLWENDTLRFGNLWAEVNTSKTFQRAGREDSLTPEQTWVSGFTSIGNRLLAVGSHQWVSNDRGRHWRIRVAADSLFDTCISFADSLHGLAGGGMTTPTSHGWVHVTSDGGQTWSGRVLSTLVPVRAVEMVTPQIGFAAGGNYQAGTGRVWSTTDGGQTWVVELQLTAEIRALKAIRISNAYVDVLAAGVFSDFRGGIWRTQLYLPDSSRALLLADPDTLDFGIVAAGHTDTLAVTLTNAGSAMDTVTGVFGGDTLFTPIWQGIPVPLHPGQSMPLYVAFTSRSGGSFSRYLSVSNVASGRVEILCTASVPLGTSPQHDADLPSRPALTVWPNPGNATFEIRYDLVRAGNVSLRVYDLTGRLVETLTETHAAAGGHIHTWDAARHASGLYFVRLNADDQAVTRKVLLIK
ncbi:MAG TPA: T9SS type A sorting domain-containing protein [bacterium]